MWECSVHICSCPWSNKLLPIYWNSKLNSAQQVLNEQCRYPNHVHTRRLFFHTWFFHIPAHDRRPFVHMITTFCVVVRTDFCVLNLELMYYSSNTTMVLSKALGLLVCLTAPSQIENHLSQFTSTIDFLNSNKATLIFCYLAVNLK